MVRLPHPFRRHRISVSTGAACRAQPRPSPSRVASPSSWNPTLDMFTSRRNHVAGVSLLELVIAIAIIGIAMGGVLTLFTVTARNSAEPMVQEQAQLIAEAYLDEILLKKFYDPDTDSVCPAREASRANYDNVCDYNALSEPPTNQFGTAVAALASY